MIIWINGAFGAGKTSAAYELHRRIPNSFVYDPENIGGFIRKNIPKELNGGDFQDYVMWRECNYSFLKYLGTEHKGIIIVPMTITNPQYYCEIIGELVKAGVIVKHFILAASKKTLLKRLKGRGDNENSWAAQQIDRCIEEFNNEVFKNHIDTENLSKRGVVEEIARLSKIDILPDNRSKVRKKYDGIIARIRR